MNHICTWDDNCDPILFVEKRQKFDNGEDPLDAEAQSQGQNPFQGFNPFGGGGYQFKFHFN